LFLTSSERDSLVSFADLRSAFTASIDINSDARIFGRPEVIADRIVALWDIDQVIVSALSAMEDKAVARYSLTRFLFHYLLREVLELDKNDGINFCRRPSEYVNDKNGRARLKESLEPVVKALVSSVDADLKRRRSEEGDMFDHKKDLKSPKKVADIRSKVIPFYQMALESKFTRSFSELWKDSVKAKS
jgi:hypothetical protein